jgi:hypothetical protein
VLVPGRRPKAEMDSNQMSLSLIVLVLDDGILQCKHHLLRFRNEKKNWRFFSQSLRKLNIDDGKKEILQISIFIAPSQIYISNVTNNFTF